MTLRIAVAGTDAADIANAADVAAGNAECR
jgi:hypothetical protein